MSERVYYHRPDAAPKLYASQPGATPGTVDLLDAAGLVIVRGCPLTDTPRPGGYATRPEALADAPAPAAPAPEAAKAKAAKIKPRKAV